MTDTSRVHDVQLCTARDWLASESSIVQVPVASIRRGDSPRLQGESKGHARSMVDAVDIPPIIVHKQTMQVIDGTHRLEAAILRHKDTIEVRFFDGTADEAFVLAVAANTAHGLPLSPKDRKAAAVRILGIYPMWSDRMIASTVGLSHHTVGVLRRNFSTGQIAQLKSRLGKDGKTRPAAYGSGRRARADRGVSPHRGDRQAAGSSATVHDARARLQQSLEPSMPTTHGPGPNFSIARGHTVVKRLWSNPAVRFNQDGKAIVQLLSRSLLLTNEAQSMSRSAPEYCLDGVAEVASVLSDFWSRLAQDLNARTKCG